MCDLDVGLLCYCCALSSNPGLARAARAGCLALFAASLLACRPTCESASQAGIATAAAAALAGPLCVIPLHSGPLLAA